MSKTDYGQEGNPILTGVDNRHLKTTERGLALARAALAEAREKALEAAEAHRLNLEAHLACERAIIRALRVEMYGEAAAQAIAEVQAAESDLIAEAEEALEGNPS